MNLYLWPVSFTSVRCRLLTCRIEESLCLYYIDDIIQAPNAADSLVPFITLTLYLLSPVSLCERRAYKFLFVCVRVCLFKSHFTIFAIVLRLRTRTRHIQSNWVTVFKLRNFNEKTTFMQYIPEEIYYFQMKSITSMIIFK